jgi:hypothetical protein
MTYVSTSSLASAAGTLQNNIDDNNNLDSSEMVFFILTHLLSFLTFTPCPLTEHPPSQRRIAAATVRVTTSWSASSD